MAKQKVQPKPAPHPEEEPAKAEPTREPVKEPKQTTDYTRRAGGYVLTERGWVLEK